LWNRYRPLFDASNFIITLVTYLGILLTFGVVFPPLAVVMCVAMLSVAWQTKLEVGRYLSNARALNAPQLARTIESECEDGVSMKKLRRGMFLVVCFCCGFYALFLFDTLGNAVGQDQALWVLLVMALFPLVLYLVIRARREYHSGTARQLGCSINDDGTMGMHEGMVEMHSRAIDLELASPAPQSADGTSHAVDENGGETFNAILKT
jgi:hypothetical protein